MRRINVAISGNVMEDKRSGSLMTGTNRSKGQRKERYLTVATKQYPDIAFIFLL